MKFLSIVFLNLTVLAVTSSAQITNGVKISTISSASVPLTGNEVVPLVQGGVTHTATVSQIIAAATAQDSATSNALQSSLTIVSNNANANAAAIITTNSLIRGALSDTNTALLAAISATNAVIRSAMTASNNAVLADISATNAATLGTVTTTSNALQTQITPLKSVANASVTNGGNATLNSVTVTNQAVANVPSSIGYTSGGQSFPVDCTQGANQSIYVTNSTSGSGCYFYPTNIVDGQQLSIVVTCKGGMYLGLGATPPGYVYRGVSPSSYSGNAISAGGAGVLSFTFVGTNIFVSRGVY